MDYSDDSVPEEGSDFGLLIAIHRWGWDGLASWDILMQYFVHKYGLHVLDEVFRDSPVE